MKELNERLNHSCSHLLAAAVRELYPNAKLGIGPAVEEGFYYDFEFEKNLTEDSLANIEDKMRELVKKDIEFRQKKVPIKEAKEMFVGQPYKLELIKDLEAEDVEEVSLYSTGDFIDLCKGPHLKSTGKINPQAFKLTRLAGAYWKSDESREQLQRIYGVCFDDSKELEDYLANRQQALENDHKKIGQDLDLFSFRAEAPGMVFWHPKGYSIYQGIIDWWREQQKRYGYLEVKAPTMMKKDLWQQSGHYEHYKESMFFAGGEDEYALRPMDCPGEIMIYKSQSRSYRDLPLRYAEIGRLFRNEQSGELNGLLRVQEITQDDAHIFTDLKSAKSEIKTIIKMVDEAYSQFELSYQMVLSTRPEKFAGKKENWDKAEKYLEEAIKESGSEVEVEEGEGAFYGPKIDFMVKDNLGRRWQLATIQLDFFMPEQFDLDYTSKEGKKVRPVIIHRVIFGSIERFTGILLEHTGGNLPLWLSPAQVKILPISDDFNSYANEVRERLLKNGLKRVEIDSSSQSLGKKIALGETEKVPYLLVVGQKEKESGGVAVRDREKGDLGLKSIEEFIKLAL